MKYVKEGALLYWFFDKNLVIERLTIELIKKEPLILEIRK
jgi:hypothetical protein